ncbi:hypothetical protein [Paenibacillus naphthalenovorans]|uniref:Uncharacterized protein n=1 Tax=Paenibacillus naphthalenovorans TaxID=162209 RepID=A0A0U2U7K6_9BACL|nr:hypothetical protein [Paenibacillus naphthalenovorans]ALS22168.1 hypothetical protein IJ22_17940 [Paenibacillus naphthalenovorans]
MNKIIRYINENEIDDMVTAIVKSGKDLKKVLYDIRMARVKFQTKSQHLQWALEKYLPKDEEE